MLYKLAEGKTDWWKRFWVLEREVAEAILFKPGKWMSYFAAACILFILLMNWFVVGQRLTKWQGFLFGRGLRDDRLFSWGLQASSGSL